MMGLIDRLKALFLPSKATKETVPTTPLKATSQSASSGKISSSTLEAQSSSRDPKEVIIKVIGYALGLGGNYRDYLPPEYDLLQITSAYNTEAYVRQAVDKYIELMFKSGWDIVGKNQKAVDYIKLRLACIAEATQIPTEKLFIGIAEDLVKYHNVIIAKARADDYPWPSGMNVQGVGDRKPIVGYFPLNITTMSVRRDKNGTVKSWQQEVVGESRVLKFKPEDIVHMYYKREKGHAFGNPFLLTVLDDIRLLRQAEENVARLIYRNLFPFYHYKVGTPERPAEDTEILEIQSAIENARLEDGLVTSERHSIEPIASNQIIDAHPYLKYFEDRVFTGLGVPAVMMGRGSTANRSTSDNQATEFVDRVKAFQKVYAADIDSQIIHELLMEGGFDPILDIDDNVDFIFKEIDYDAKIKAENHAVFLYEHNTITEDEMRRAIGLEPITDRAKMFMNLITIPVAQAKAEAKSQASTDNRNSPTNQKRAQPATKKEYVKAMADAYEELGDSVITLLQLYYEGGTDGTTLSSQLASVYSLYLEKMYEYTREYIGENTKAEAAIARRVTRNHGFVVLSANKFSSNEDELMATIHASFEINRSLMAEFAEDLYESRAKEGDVFETA